METVEYKNISFTVWDVGGQDKVCGLYDLYFAYEICQNFLKNLIISYTMNLSIFFSFLFLIDRVL